VNKFFKLIDPIRCGVATSLGNNDLEMPTKLFDESVQKLPCEGGELHFFFQLFNFST
jgi:hypothetical protein